MAKTAEESVGALEPGALVCVPGVSGELWTTDSFVPVLKRDMPLDVRRDTIRDVLQKSTFIDDRLNLIAGEMLYEVSKNGYWRDWAFMPDGQTEERPYEDFTEYCEHELGMRLRKARYLIAIYAKFVVELEIPIDVLRDLEWSKAREVCRVITKDNWRALLEKIKGMSRTAVKDMVKRMEGADDSDPGETMVKLTFLCSSEQAENIRAALEVGRTMAASEKDGHALDLICSDFIAGAAGTGSEGALIKLDIARRNLERAFGVKLDVSEVDSERYSKVGE